MLKNNSISFNILSKVDDSIILFQNYHTNWECEVNGQKTIIKKTPEGFMKVPVKAGVHQFYFKYWPQHAIIAFLISVVVWIMLMLYLFKNRKQQRLLLDIYSA